MAQREIVGGIDAWVSQARQSANRSRSDNLRVRNAVDDWARGLLYIKAPAPVTAGTTVIEARLVLHLKWASHADFTIRAIPVSSSWKGRQVTWDNQPDVRQSGLLGTAASVDVTGARAANRGENVWITFDVTDHLQAVADGAGWFGWRLGMMTEGVHANFFTSEVGAQWRRPRLVTEYSNAPAPPTDLSPSGGRFVSVAHPVLRYTYLDYGGNRDLLAHHVQIDPFDETDTPNIDGRWNPGPLPASEPELDLSTTDYPGLANGGLARWRIRAQDGAGLWSPWSDWASFERLNKGELVLNNPSAEPDNFVQEVTPPITWTHSGPWPQEAYQVIIQQKMTSGWENIFNSRKRSGDDQSLTLPWGVIRWANWTSDPQPDRPDWKVRTEYRAVVRTWDGQGRQATPGDPVFYWDRQPFTVREGATARVDNLAVAWQNPYPWVDVTWTRSTAPDQFLIVRGGRIIEAVTPDEVDQGDGTYRFRDKRVTLNREHVWAVFPVVNGEMAPLEGSHVRTTVKSQGIWLVNPNRAAWYSGVQIFGFGGHASVDMAMEDQGEDYEIVGRSSPVRVTNALGAGKGSVSGVVVDTDKPNLKAWEWRNRLRDFKEDTGGRLVLVTMDYAMPIVAYNISDGPTPNHGVIDISFDYVQDNVPDYAEG